MAILYDRFELTEIDIMVLFLPFGFYLVRHVILGFCGRELLRKGEVKVQWYMLTQNVTVGHSARLLTSADPDPDVKPG